MGYCGYRAGDDMTVLVAVSGENRRKNMAKRGVLDFIRQHHMISDGDRIVAGSPGGGFRLPVLYIMQTAGTDTVYVCGGARQPHAPGRRS